MANRCPTLGRSPSKYRRDGDRYGGLEETVESALRCGVLLDGSALSELCAMGTGTSPKVNSVARPPYPATLPANPITPAVLTSASSRRSARAINCRAVSRCGSTGPRK